MRQLACNHKVPSRSDSRSGIRRRRSSLGRWGRLFREILGMGAVQPTHERPGMVRPVIAPRAGVVLQELRCPHLSPTRAERLSPLLCPTFYRSPAPCGAWPPTTAATCRPALAEKGCASMNRAKSPITKAVPHAASTSALRTSRRSNTIGYPRNQKKEGDGRQNGTAKVQPSSEVRALRGRFRAMTDTTKPIGRR